MSSLEMIQEEINTFDKASQKAKELIVEAGSTKSSTKKDFLLGIAAYEVRKYSLALEHLQACFLAEPNAEVAIRIAMCNLHVADYQMMAKWATKALEIDSNGSFKMILFDELISFISIFALSQFHLGRIDEAVAACKIALGLAKDDRTAINVMVNCHLAKGQIKEAEKFKSLLTKNGKKENKSSIPDGLIAIALGTEKANI